MKPRLARIDLSLVFGLFLIVLVGGGILIAYLLSRPPDPYADAAKDLPAAIAAYRAAGFPWEAKDIDPNPPSEAENAATFIKQAEARMGLRQYFALRTKLANWVALGRYEKLQGPLASVRKVLALSRAAASRSRLDFNPDWDLGPAMNVTMISEAGPYGKLLCYDALAAAAAGDIDKAKTDLETAMKLSKLAMEPRTMHSLYDSMGLARTALDFYALSAYVDRNDAAAEEILTSSLDRVAYVPKLGDSSTNDSYEGLALARNFRLYGGLKAVDARVRRESYLGLWDQTIDPSRLMTTGIPASEEERANLDGYLRAWINAKRALAEPASDPRASAEGADLAMASATKPISPLNVIIRAIRPPSFASIYDSIMRFKASIVVTKAFLRCAAIHAKTADSRLRSPRFRASGSILIPGNRSRSKSLPARSASTASARTGEMTAGRLHTSSTLSKRSMGATSSERCLRYGRLRARTQVKVYAKHEVSPRWLRE